MSKNNLKQDQIINGSDIMAVARRDNSVYRLDSIRYYREISFYNLEKDKTYVFDFSQELTESYEIIGMITDFVIDDDTVIDTPFQEAEKGTGFLDIQEFTGDVLTGHTKIGLTPFTRSLSGLFLRKDKIFKCLVNTEVNKIGFICRPVIFESEIKFVATNEVKGNDNQST